MKIKKFVYVINDWLNFLLKLFGMFIIIFFLFNRECVIFTLKIDWWLMVILGISLINSTIKFGGE